jgi:hypothetical protein
MPIAFTHFLPSFSENFKYIWGNFTATKMAEQFPEYIECFLYLLVIRGACGGRTGHVMFELLDSLTGTSFAL